SLSAPSVGRMRQKLTRAPTPNHRNPPPVRKRTGHRAATGMTGFLVLAATVSGFCAELQDPVLNLLLKKGVVSEEEARNAQIEADAIRTNGVLPSSSSKWKISNAIKDIELFGDVRTRYEYRHVQDPNGGDIELQRFRLSVRLGLRGEA